MARQTKSVLELCKLSNNKVLKVESQFYTNGNQSVIEDLLESKKVKLKKIEF